MACLNELDDLVSGPAASETECVAGIGRADAALGQHLSDTDLQCSIQVRRAQLLKMMVSSSCCMAIVHTRSTCIYKIVVL